MKAGEKYAMPRKPKRPCRHPGCPKLSDAVYCEEHRGFYARDSASVRGYDAKWRKARDLFLKRHPLCAECMRKGKITPATVVDHKIPHRGDKRLFWDMSNWQPLCKGCHDVKTGQGL